MKITDSELNLIGWMVPIVIALALIFGCACASPSAAVDPAPAPEAPAETTAPAEPVWYSTFRAAAVVWGLTNVQASAYGGWDGACPGCDVDAKANYSYYVSGGIPTTMLLNAGATKAAAQAAIASAAAGLASNDCLIIDYSSHGTLVRDLDGDEADGTGQDSALCMFDGIWVDDDFLAFLKSVVPDGVIVRIGSDCCHSEGNFRGYARSFQQAVSGGRWGQIPRFELRAKDDLPFAITQMAGSRKLSYAYGADDGGTFTLTRLANATGFWKSWFEATKAKMPGNQTPVWVESGPVTDEIRNAPVFPKGK